MPWPGLQKSFDVLQFWADPGSCSPSAYVMIFSTVAINAVNRVSGGKRLFLASLQQTCNEYLYLNINKSKLAFLLQKSSGDFWVISWRTGEHLHVGMAGCNDFCSPGNTSTANWVTLEASLDHPSKCALTFFVPVHTCLNPIGTWWAIYWTMQE